MRNAKTWFAGVVLFSSVAFFLTATARAAPDGLAAAAGAQELLWEPPGEPEGKVEEPADPDERPRSAGEHERRPPPAPGAPERRLRGAARAGGPPPSLPRLQMMERLLPLIAERHPELAERLRRVRERSPEEFRHLLADALALRLEGALRRYERRLMARGGPPDGPRPPEPPPGGPEWGGREREMRERHMALGRETQELDRHNEELERRSRELARRFRELHERRDPDVERELDDVRHQMGETVEEHFNVRTELRRIEMRRVEMQLDHLREVVERIRGDLERREDARGSIIERRLRQLLGEQQDGW